MADLFTLCFFLRFSLYLDPYSNVVCSEFASSGKMDGKSWTCLLENSPW